MAAAVFGVFTPGVSPLTAVAQDDAPPPWAPQGEIGGPPPDSGKPDKEYLERVQCISSASTQKEIPKANLLKNGSWGQRHLRLREVQRHIREKSAHGKVGVNEKTGKPLRVAVIDTGVTPHPFFHGRVKPGGDYVQKNGAGKDGLLDCDGHGTQVAGIIAGDPKSSNIGFIGVAPDVEIISIRQSSQNYSKIKEDELKQRAEERKQEREEAAREAEAKAREAEFEREQAELKEQLEEEKRRRSEDDKNGDTNSSQQGGAEGPDQPRAQETDAGAGNLGTLAQAIVRAVKTHKVDVINMSVDACRPNTGNYRVEGDEAKVRAAINYAADNGVVVVAAAGNSAPPDSGGGCIQNDIRTPADPRVPDPNHPRTIVTPPWFAADDTMLAVGAIQIDGSVTDFSMRGPWVSVAAPGTDIISLDPAGTNQIVNVTFDGTNDKPQPLQGTSFAAPYVAGLAVLVKQMHPELDARGIIKRIKATAQHPGATGGHDQFVGYGVIDPMAAVTAQLPEEMGIPLAQDRQLPSDMPSLAEPDPTPMIVALAGTGGGIAALGVTLFAVRSVRRRHAAEETAK